MYVDTLSGSTVSMLNRFMSQKEEEYMIISDRFCIIGDNKEFYISFVLGKMADVMQILDNKLMHSSIIMSELKKACGKRISIDAVEIKLKIDDLCLYKEFYRRCTEYNARIAGVRKIELEMLLQGYRMSEILNFLSESDMKVSEKTLFANRRNFQKIFKEVFGI